MTTVREAAEQLLKTSNAGREAIQRVMDVALNPAMCDRNTILLAWEREVGVFEARGAAARELAAALAGQQLELDITAPGAPAAVAMPTTLADWQREIHAYALAKGWWDKDNRTFGDICALFTTEISEAYEEWRAGHEVTEVRVEMGKPEGVPVELADVVIRILDYCGRKGIDLQAVMELKHRFNLTRAYRHGNKRV